jgi:hypothetical protein
MPSPMCREALATDSRRLVRPTANKQEFSRCRDNLMGLLRIRLKRYRTTTMRYEVYLPI